MRSLLVMTLCAGCAAPSANRRAAEAVVWRSLTAPDAAERRQATRVVVEVGDPLLESGLGPRLGDSDGVVQALAAAALAGELPEARELLRRALDSADAATRLAALDGVAALGDGAAQAARLAADDDESVRARAAWMLASMRARPAVGVLERLLGDLTPGVRAEALRALTSLDAERAAAHAEAALADAALSVRLAALPSLAQAGGGRARLLALAGGADRFIALRAAVQLQRSSPDARALRAVEEAAGARHPALRVAAMNAAGELGEAGRALARAHLGDAEPEVRLAAARALLAAGGDLSRESPARAVLRAALRGPLGLEAADELARLGDAEGRRAIDQAAHAPDVHTRRAAIAMLGSLSPEPPELAAALGDHDAGVRLTAARALLRRALRPYLR